MRKSLWGVLAIAILSLAVGAPSAQATTYTVAFTCGASITCSHLPSAPNTAFPPGTVDATYDGELFAFTTSIITGSPSDTWIWGACAAGTSGPVIDCGGSLDVLGIHDNNTGANFRILVGPIAGFGDASGSLVFTPIAATPELGTGGLMLIGVIGSGLMAIRKRPAHGPHQVA
jgi:hypothetical protein